VEQARGRLGPACAEFAEAVRELERPEVATDDAVDDRRTLAVSDSELAECELAAGRWSAAAALLDKAIRLHERNGESYNKALLAQVLATRGEVARAVGETDAARGFFDRALRLGRSSSQEAPVGDQYSRWVLAQVLVEMASFQASQGEGAEAERKYQEAQGLGERLREGEPLSKRHALVWLHARAGQEALTGDRERATRLHTERCALAREFQYRDGEDVRFVFADCPSVRRGGEEP
ncbi:MAG: tetratricopeptide repeat protein, partial [Archangium sp.]